jgi:hypothetical protein
MKEANHPEKMTTIANCYLLLDPIIIFVTQLRLQNSSDKLDHHKQKCLCLRKYIET